MFTILSNTVVGVSTGTNQALQQNSDGRTVWAQSVHYICSDILLLPDWSGATSFHLIVIIEVNPLNHMVLIYFTYQP